MRLHSTTDIPHSSMRLSRPILKLLLSSIILMSCAWLPATAQAFTIYFSQSGYSGPVWLQIQDPNHNSTSANFVASYGSGTSISFDDGNGGKNLMSAPVKLSAIGAGGLTVAYSNSAVFFIFYDDPTNNSRTAAPAHLVSTQRFQPFEVTMTGNSGDQGNLTAINYFTAPLSIRSYSVNPKTNPSAPVLQQTDWGSATARKIGARMAALTNSNPSAVMKNAAGKVVRYIGPSNYNGANPWPSFVPYMQSVHTANQSTHIARSNGFNFPDGSSVYQFGCDMQATAGSDGTVTVTGKLTHWHTGDQAASDWDNATVTISAANVNDYNNAIYGQIQNNAVTLTGQAWTDFQTYAQGILKNPALPYNASTNPSLYDTAYATTVNMIVGEITTGILGGFYNSNYMVNGTQLKNMVSNSWWSLVPMVAFSTIQPGTAYYNTYANVIYEESGNTVYGVPYSDRFGSGPLVNTVQLGQSSVNYWIVGIGAPLAANTPTVAPESMLLLGN
ncbi:hypothetical protein [Fundidesulfovibrio agrisoli]|uniref:hypothetical protein n=1 Tax=Fundidesulfovibrio agrisoli TaxID=2922717 RepID=UPI001FAC5F8C|nr:hypothetical protein [Fundidesulfovibrio agrisoli]